MSQSKKRVIIGLSIALGFLAAGIGGYFILTSGTGSEEVADAQSLRKANALQLARDYSEQGEYDRALGLLEQILLDNPQDAEVRALLDGIIALRREALARAQAEAQARDQKNAPTPTPERQNAELDAAEAQRAAALARAAEAEAREREALAAQRESEAQIARQLAEQQQREITARQAQELAERQAEEERIARLSAEEAAKARQQQDLLTQARASLSTKDYARAKTLLNQAIQVNPANALPYARMAEVFIEEDSSNRINQDQARTFSEQAKDRDPNLWESYYTLGRVYAAQRRYPEAIAEYDRARVLNPGTGNARVLFELGNAQFLSGRFADARVSYEASIQLDSTNERAFFNLGSTYERLENQDAAIDAYRRAVAVRTNYATAYNRIGEIQLSQGNAAGALENLKRAVDLDPSMRHVRSYAQVLFEVGRYEESYTSYENVLKAEPDNPINNYNLATVLLALDRPEEALDHAAKAVQLDSGRAEYSYTLGLAAKMLGGYPQAEEFFVRAIQQNPQYLLPRIELGALYIEQESADLALLVLQDAEKINQNSFEVQSNLGAAYRLSGEYDKSVDYLRKAIQTSPQDPNLRYSLALTRLRMEDLSGAEESFELAIALDGTFWAAYHRLGEVLIALENPERAKDVFSQLLELNPQYWDREVVSALLEGL